jgi:hypothetical protein
VTPSPQRETGGEHWPLSRRSLIGKVGAVGLGATAALFAGGGRAQAAPAVPRACCTLASGAIAPWDLFLRSCICSDMYIWRCCLNGARYLCGECYCEGYASYTRSGSC